MTDINAIPRENPRELTDTDIEVEIAGIRVGHELGGLTLTPEAEAAARAVLAGEETADEAIARSIADLRRRNGL
ncbi:hypothetical protein MWT96_25150 (plasmid) [Prescottella equi]|uniref:Antitoxin VbhA domain-containing protein n=1 Tax=Rhodococcus hoagii TaxID=43767 RepID=A0A9Q2PAQ1_RHOHA|nr:hypothetical protein [Prescottella equi]AVR64944.1 hypothetical protein pRERM660 [Prescottella equi]MBM4479781.1 hypothetical protein [Prescottella equi]MBM4487728.1 hypothetical protein [Prescottella equi]MBM4498410.1 hypothetical protein [Prescottella equi]MBM4507710.1 hypothetical protein [Prescottella equi]